MIAVRITALLALSFVLAAQVLGDTPRRGKTAPRPADERLAPAARALTERFALQPALTPADLSVWGECDLDGQAPPERVVTFSRGGQHGLLALVRGDTEVVATMDLFAPAREVYVVSLGGNGTDNLLVRTGGARPEGGMRGRQLVVAGGATGLRTIWERAEVDEIDGNADVTRERKADLWCLVVDEGGVGLADRITAHRMQFRAGPGAGPDHAQLIGQHEQPLSYDVAAGRIVDPNAQARRAGKLSAGQAAAAATR